MGLNIVDNAICQCSFGMAPSALGILPNGVVAGTGPAATIMDNIPFVNIRPFGMCQSMANPAVLAATIGAGGVLTPQPCTPVTPSPWVMGQPAILVKGQPALDDSSKLMCAYAGVITIVSPGQATVLV
jgi:hypothetical protein